MSIIVRPARASDADALGRMGAALVQQHHEFDTQRFLLPDDVESGYRWWLSKEMKSKDAVVLVAKREGEVVGYLYGRVEARDWSTLRDRHGGLHDIWVDESARGTGAGRLLAEAALRRFAELGAPRVILMSATKNESAQKFFAKLGWRPTMVEMTREISDEDSP
ncbi:MAG: GNAT family N-acetyltransferase [Hyalangium sp.]|uniref:GNAT family N-acetyltransferase n=1 Tax=Hyalangium sp. TaxID=2028555 RepID=UPI00389A4869